MTVQDVQETERESKDSGVPMEKTFAAKWLNQAYKLVLIMISFSVVVVATQVILFVLFPENEMIIPGQAVIHSFSGAAATALVGGEKIAGKVKSNGKVNL